MKSQMTLFAFGLKWEGLGASGPTNGVSPSAATACCAKNLSSSKPASAAAMNPPPDCHRNSRRVRPQNCRPPSLIVRTPSIEIDELVQVQGHQAEDLERAARTQCFLLAKVFDQLQAPGDLAVAGRTLGHRAEREPHLRRGVAGRLLLELD